MLEEEYINGIKTITHYPDKCSDEEREQFLYEFNKLLDNIINKSTE